jgi:hypothetical protein
VLDRWVKEVERVVRAEMKDGWKFAGSSGTGLIC